MEDYKNLEYLNKRREWVQAHLDPSITCKLRNIMNKPEEERYLIQVEIEDHINKLCKEYDKLEGRTECFNT